MVMHVRWACAMGMCDGHVRWACAMASSRSVLAGIPCGISGGRDSLVRGRAAGGRALTPHTGSPAHSSLAHTASFMHMVRDETLMHACGWVPTLHAR